MSAPTTQPVWPPQNQQPRRRLRDRIPPAWRTMPVAVLASLVVLLGAGLIAALATRPGATGPTADGGAAADDAPAAETVTLENTAIVCTTRYGYVGTVYDDGNTLDFDMEGEDFGSGEGTIAGLECVLDRLGAPDWVTQEMNSTRALDGRQTADWDGYSASWRYHPDDGLDVLITVR